MKYQTCMYKYISISLYTFVFPYIHIVIYKCLRIDKNTIYQVQINDHAIFSILHMETQPS